MDMVGKHHNEVRRHHNEVWRVALKDKANLAYIHGHARTCMTAMELQKNLEENKTTHVATHARACGTLELFQPGEKIPMALRNTPMHTRACVGLAIYHFSHVQSHNPPRSRMHVRDHLCTISSSHQTQSKSSGSHSCHHGSVPTIKGRFIHDILQIFREFGAIYGIGGSQYTPINRV